MLFYSKDEIMTQYIALLRSINVSGHNTLKMAELRSVMTQHGYKDVSTYIQSGNIVFSAENQTTGVLEDAITELIKSNFILDVPCIVFTPEYLKMVLEKSPYKPGENIDEKRLLLAFLKSEPLEEHIAVLKQYPFKEEYFEVKQKVLYAHLPNGFGKAKLTTKLMENKLKVAVTTRNWKTANKLLEMAAM